jgi:two-component system nitrogen regulation sensor histidine kinase GlnL
MTLDTGMLWSSLPIPALMVARDNTIHDVNPAAESFLNASRKSLLGHVVWHKILMDTPLEGAFDRVRNGFAPLFVNAVEVGSPHRKPSACDIRIAPMPDAEETILILFENRDLAGRLDRSLSSKSAAKSAIGMAEMLAHEIKNPLAGITGAAQLISMNVDKEDLELTDLIVAETRRILDLLKQVEDFGNLRPPACQAVNIHDILDRARKTAVIGFAAHMKIELDYDPSLPPAWVDSDQIQQVFLNLLKNAAQVGRPGGTITLRSFYELSFKLRNHKGAKATAPLQVEIIDDGPGIPDDIVGDIFEPFVSGRENGTGLGLALISKIIADHDGWITVDSVPGRTVFRVSLPVPPKAQIT